LGSGLALAMARPARASTFERRFLFFFATGGWDCTAVFDPHFDSEAVQHPSGSEPATAGGISYVSGTDRSSVDAFLANWGSRTCFVNGLDAHSVGHGSARQFVMTGQGAGGVDWPTLIARYARNEYAYPHVVMSGPAWPGPFSAQVARGAGGTMFGLVDGTILTALGRGTSIPSEAADRRADAFVAQRAAAWAAAHPDGEGGKRSEALIEALSGAAEVEGSPAILDSSGGPPTTATQAARAVKLLAAGAARCAMVSIDGDWDTHSNNDTQPGQIDAFFGLLDEIVGGMARTPGLVRSRLLDEVTIVALSDFGRSPTVNSGGGKEHWPYGSAILIGSGIRGGRSVGATDGELLSQPIDLATGEADASGDIPAVEHLGAALLELAGIESSSLLPDVPVLDAVRA
jgi:hypothetical protein